MTRHRLVAPARDSGTPPAPDVAWTKIQEKLNVNSTPLQGLPAGDRASSALSNTQSVGGLNIKIVVIGGIGKEQPMIDLSVDLSNLRLDPNL